MSYVIPYCYICGERGEWYCSKCSPCSECASEFTIHHYDAETRYWSTRCLACLHLDTGPQASHAGLS
jgi:hypothetical protein